MTRIVGEAGRLQTGGAGLAGPERGGRAHRHAAERERVVDATVERGERAVREAGGSRELVLLRARLTGGTGAGWMSVTVWAPPSMSGIVGRQSREAGTPGVEERARIALGDIAGQVRSIAIDIVRASAAGETDHGVITEAPTEELLAALPLPEPAAA
jgi:hypothetical protein